MRNQSLKTLTAGNCAREKNAAMMVKSMYPFYLYYIELTPTWPQFLQPCALLKGLSVPFAASRHA